MSSDSDQISVAEQESAANNQQALTVVDRQELEKGRPIQTVSSQRSKTRPLVQQSSTLSEFIKFGIVALILLGTPLLISLLNPLIFGQIVPAILGSNLPETVPVLPVDQVIQPPTADPPPVALPTLPQSGIGGQTIPTPLPTVEPAAAEPVELSVHIVRSGETLSSIAGLYGFTAEDIAAVNDIQDPNQIFSGQVLILPSPVNP